MRRKYSRVFPNDLLRKPIVVMSLSEIKKLVKKVKLSGTESQLNSIATRYKNITYQRVHSRDNYYTGKDLLNRNIGKNDWNLLFTNNPPPKESKILNVGCGFGLVERWGLDNGYNCYGVEPDPVASAIASRLLRLNGYHKRQYIFQEFGEKLHFKNNYFNVVVSLSTLEHVSCPRQVIDEMLRVLKPGGLLVITCPSYATFWEFHYSLPWLPIFSKKTAKLYIRLMGRSQEFIDEINFIKPDLLTKHFKTKHIKFKDASKELMYLTVQRKDGISHPFLRAVIKWTGKLPFMLISRLHAYPYIKLVATKRFSV